MAKRKKSAAKKTTAKRQSQDEELALPSFSNMNNDEIRQMLDFLKERSPESYELIVNDMPYFTELMDPDLALIPPLTRKRTRSQVRAENLVERALESDFVDEDLLQQALKLDPKNVDALMEMARLVDEPEQALEYVDRALVEAREEAGDFSQYREPWRHYAPRQLLSILDYRAGILDELNRLEESLDVIRETMVLDPKDHAGNRYLYLSKVCNQRRWAELKEFLAQWNPEIENDIQFLYARALYAFHEEGDTERSQGLVKLALDANGRVPQFICGDVPLSLEFDDMPEDGAPGSFEEAENYARVYLSAWRGTPGAVTWLRTWWTQIVPPDEFTESDLKLLRQAARTSVRTLRQEVKKLEGDDLDEWLVDVRYLDSTSSWGMLVASMEDGQPVRVCTFPGEPNTDMVLAELFEGMCSPNVGDPRRPACLHLLEEEWLSKLTRGLKGLDIDVQLSDRAQEFRESLERGNQPLPDTPVTEVEQIPSMVWELDWSPFEIWAPDENGAPSQPWTVTIVDVETNDVVASTVTRHEPTETEITETLRAGVVRPMHSEPARPGLIRVRTTDNKLTVADWVKAADIDIEVGDLPGYDRVYSEISSRMMGDRPKGLTEIEGMSLELIGELYDAAVAFYRSGPWTKIRPDDFVALSCSALTPKTWYAAVMGQLGMGLGLMLFDSSRTLRTLMNASPTGDPEKAAEMMRGLSFSLEEKFAVSPADVAAAEQFGWPVAAPEAWPAVAYIGGRDTIRPLSYDELRWLVACVRTVPEFWDKRASVNTFPMEIDGESFTVSARRHRV